MRLSSIPVIVRIHSSVVSIRFSKSAFVKNMWRHILSNADKTRIHYTSPIPYHLLLVPSVNHKRNERILQPTDTTSPKKVLNA